MRFRLCGIRVEISYLLLCFAAMSVILGIFQSFCCCVLAVIIHESGHLITMRALGYFPERIKILLFEISISDPSRQERSARENMLIIFFGPAANFICVLPLFLVYLCGTEKILPFAAANLSVGLFNLLPVMSLDGGQLLFILLCRSRTPEQAEKIVCRLTFISVFPIAALGFVILFHSHYNFSLLFVCVYLIFALFTRQEKYY